MSGGSRRVYLRSQRISREVVRCAAMLSGEAGLCCRDLSALPGAGCVSARDVLGLGLEGAVVKVIKL